MHIWAIPWTVMSLRWCLAHAADGIDRSSIIRLTWLQYVSMQRIFRLKPPLLWCVTVPLALPVTIYASPNRNSHDSYRWRMSCVTSRILDYCVWNCVITVPMGCWKCMTGKCRTVICSPCCIYSVLCFPRWSPTLVFVLQDIVYSDD